MKEWIPQPIQTLFISSHVQEHWVYWCRPNYYQTTTYKTKWSWLAKKALLFYEAKISRTINLGHCNLLLAQIMISLSNIDIKKESINSPPHFIDFDWLMHYFWACKPDLVPLNFCSRFWPYIFYDLEGTYFVSWASFFFDPKWKTHSAISNIIHIGTVDHLWDVPPTYAVRFLRDFSDFCKNRIWSTRVPINYT